MSKTTRRSPRASCRIVVGMSHPQRRAALSQALSDEGHVVVDAHDGSDLIRLMAKASNDDDKERPDLVIADVTLPGCSGLGVLEAVRQLRWDTPVFLIVDNNQDDIARDAFALGADRVFEKPIDVGEVSAAVSTFLIAHSDDPRPRRTSGLRIVRRPAVG